MAADRVSREREANMVLFRAVHDVARRHAGEPFHQVVSALASTLPGTPRLDEAELRRIAEEISVGRDPSGL
ncbi:hypothetical protein [Planotetraspora mira]|jgi:hypothetical protein|uniref:Uncharacterized protein n=1 Tax=Planotetraspora mira TaxID=58121 RepID=A0A8J3TNC7_9ACTN|nr:hypothetical protein [Planotetraspora mira]GII28362.1 hypothetical protein Pmi06nite_18040 [Planotetraspora mira]